MKRYPSYKDSGVEWIGEIPADWMLRKIKHDTYVKGRIGWQGLKTDEYLPKGFAYLVTGKDFSNGFINWESCFYVDQTRYSEDPYIQLKEGDLLIIKDGTIGKIALVKDMDKPSTLNSGIFLVRPMNGNYSTSFLYWILCSSVFSGFFDYHKSGSTISHLYQNVFVEFGFPVPPAHLQSQIVNYLNHKIHQIDDLIEKKQKLIELLKEERNALINHAVTKGLDPTVPMKDSGIDWLGDIPENWEVKPLKHVSNIVLGKMLTNDDKGGYKLKPYLRAQNINWFKINTNDIKSMWFSEKEMKQYLVKKDDLLVSEGGEVGRTCIWKEEVKECYIQNSVHKVTFLNGNIPQYFLNLFYNFGVKGHFDAIVSRVSIAHLTREKLKEISVVVPPVKEQKTIIRFIDDKCSNIENSIQRINDEIDLLTEYKIALIYEAITGKIDVRDYQINHA